MHFSEHPISFFVCVPSFFAWQSCYRTWSVKRKRCKSPNFKSAPSPAPTGRTTFFSLFFSFLFGRLRQREPQSGRWEAPKRIRPIKEQQITCASFSSFFFLSSAAVDIRVAPLPRIRQPPADFQSMIADLTFTASSPCFFFCFKR